MSDQGMKFDNGKIRPSLVPPIGLKHTMEVMEHGARKYAPDNWKLVQDAEVRYFDALWRHVQQYHEGEYLDQDSGLPHLAHICANALMLMDYREGIVKNVSPNGGTVDTPVLEAGACNEHESSILSSGTNIEQYVPGERTCFPKYAQAWELENL